MKKFSSKDYILEGTRLDSLIKTLTSEYDYVEPSTYLGLSNKDKLHIRVTPVIKKLKSVFRYEISLTDNSDLDSYTVEEIIKNNFNINKTDIILYTSGSDCDTKYICFYTQLICNNKVLITGSAYLTEYNDSIAVDTIKNCIGQELYFIPYNVISIYHDISRVLLAYNRKTIKIGTTNPESYINGNKSLYIELLSCDLCIEDTRFAKNTFIISKGNDVSIRDFSTNSNLGLYYLSNSFYCNRLHNVDINVSDKKPIILHNDGAYINNINLFITNKRDNILEYKLSNINMDHNSDLKLHLTLKDNLEKRNDKLSDMLRIFNNVDLSFLINFLYVEYDNPLKLLLDQSHIHKLKRWVYRDILILKNNNEQIKYDIIWVSRYNVNSYNQHVYDNKQVILPFIVNNNSDNMLTSLIEYMYMLGNSSDDIYNREIISSYIKSFNKYIKNIVKENTKNS